MKNLVSIVVYRLRQVRQQLGFVKSLSQAEQREVAAHLSFEAFHLFLRMSPADQSHSLRVCRGLQERGCQDQAILTAALLHDVGKAEGRVPFWTRPVIVMMKRVAPRCLNRLTVYPVADRDLPHWRRALSYAWWHAEVGADLAQAAGVSMQSVHYIRMHHRPDSPELAELHLVDEAS
jgi:hypothetical protein